jgi:hypothetical protein
MVSVFWPQCRSAFAESGEIVPQRLDLSRVALQFARHAIGFNVEDYYCAVHLDNVLVFGPSHGYVFLVLGVTNSSGGKVVAFMVEAQTCRMAAAYGVLTRSAVSIVGKCSYRILSFSVKVSGYSCARTNGSTSERFIALGACRLRCNCEFKVNPRPVT